jgi:hypothetical protein
LKRHCTNIPLDEITSEFANENFFNIDIYVDDEIYDNFIILLNELSYKKKFRRIVYEILKGRYKKDLYEKEEVSDKAKNLTGMKFKGKENLRIYCKEFFLTNKKIVMITILKKKVQKASNKKIKNILESIGDYEYEFNK